MDNFLLLPRALVAFLFDAGFAGALGAMLCLLWLRRDESVALAEQSLVGRRIRWPLLGCAMGMVAALPCQAWLTTATMLGSASAADVWPQLKDVLTATHAGRVLVPDFALAVALLGAAAWAAAVGGRARGGRRLWLWGGLALAVLLGAMRSASGHAAGDGDFSLRELVQFVHLMATAVWAGGVMLAGWVVLPRLRCAASLEPVTHFGRRLSLAATWAVVLVAISGIYNAWLGLDGHLPPLVHTQWGWLLTAKSALVLLALGMGARNRWLLARNDLLEPQDAAEFVRWMRVEAAVMLAILAVTGFLASSAPAMAQ
jgi:putative copper resistance protein D